MAAMKRLYEKVAPQVREGKYLQAAGTLQAAGFPAETATRQIEAVRRDLAEERKRGRRNV